MAHPVGHLYVQIWIRHYTRPVANDYAVHVQFGIELWKYFENITLFNHCIHIAIELFL